MRAVQVGKCFPPRWCLAYATTGLRIIVTRYGTINKVLQDIVSKLRLAQTCQRSHWKAHKEFCEVWAATSQNNGEFPVAKVKKLMTKLIWLVRGIPEYTDYLFEEYLASKRLGRRGCIEFYFDQFDDLFDAVSVLEELPIIDEDLFYPMPLAPTYREKPDGKGPLGQKIPIRCLTRKSEAAFAEAVDKKMTFTESTIEARPNMMKCIDLVGNSDTMFLICVTVKLQGTYSTHMYDFVYRRLSWFPEDGPFPKPKK